jgi:pyruvate formate lyase activating enzyme
MGSTPQPLIVDIKENSLDDGPGIRSVVFFKGCPLSCVWCHNPECIGKDVELSYDASTCVQSGECVKACKEDALSLAKTLVVDTGRCTACFDCVSACPSGALSKMGESMSVQELVARLCKDKPFFDNSGGGVTLSGGEPTYFMDYLCELLQALKRQGIHTLLQTCGAFSFPTFERLVYPHLDLIYYDLKLADPQAHKQYCGAANETILDNFIRLHAMALDGGVEVLPRIPLIAGITDTVTNLGTIATLLREHGVEKVQLMPYNPLWREKVDKLGMQSRFVAASSKWMTRDQIEACADVFRRLSVDVLP